ncbi:MAG: hypothetical protein HYY48_05080 [Gammaproteobacteria bacterium]|nr:hypothetical protein [Gammaproteobacteria bacterium]
MRRRLLANVVLAVAVAVLAAGLLLTPEPVPEAPPPLTDIAPDSIHRIRIERANDVPMNFERRDMRWVMSAPVSAPAYPARIESVLGLLYEPSHARLSIPAGERARFMLDAPPVSLYFDEHRFDFGDIEPLEARRYVLYSGQVHLIADTLVFQLTQNAGFFIDPKLLAGDAPPQRIVYPQFTLADDNGSWRQEPDAGLAADRAKDVSLNWETARAITVQTPIEGTATGHIRIESGAGDPVEFDILSKDDNVILGRADLNVQYHLDAYTAEQLLLKQQVESKK